MAVAVRKIRTAGTGRMIEVGAAQRWWQPSGGWPQWRRRRQAAVQRGLRRMRALWDATGGRDGASQTLLEGSLGAHNNLRSFA